jgi:hypothetical protein
MRFSFLLASALSTLGVTLFSAAANAQMMSSYLREQTGTLPRGRILISMVGLQSSIDRMYSRTGEAKTLSSQFNQQVSVNTIVKDEPVRGSQLAGLFLSNGLNLSDGVGALEGDVTGSVNGKVPVLGYGLTDDLGIYLNLPVIEFDIRAQYRFVQSSAMLAFLQKLRDSDQASAAREFEVALATSLENKLYRSQYQWSSNLKKTVLGDARINMVKVLNTSPTFQSQLQPFVILPTATDLDLQDLYGLRAGDHRLGLGFKYAAQKKWGMMQVNAAATATHLFPSEQGRRLPKDASDELNEWSDARVWVAGGDQLQGQLQVRYPMPRWVGFSLGLDWKQKWAETWFGSQHGSESYRWGAEKTASSLVSTYAAVDLNSIQSFLEGGFLFPATAELGVGLPIAGKNAIAEPVIQLQGTMFF